MKTNVGKWVCLGLGAVTCIIALFALLTKPISREAIRWSIASFAFTAQTCTMDCPTDWGVLAFGLLFAALLLGFGLCLGNLIADISVWRMERKFRTERWTTPT